MGGKGSYGPPPIVQQNQPDPMASIGPQLEAMMASITSMQESLATPPELPPLPEATVPGAVDVEALTTDLANLTQVSEQEQADASTGLSDTVLTSPLLDEEDVDTVSASLIGA